MDPVSIYQQHILKRVVAHLCLTLGFNSVGSDALDTLSDLMRVYIMELGKRSHQYSETYDRIESNLSDLQQTFADFNVNVQEIIDYLRCVEPGSLAIEVPRFPATPKPSVPDENVESPSGAETSRGDNEDGVARPTSQTLIANGAQTLDQVSSDRQIATTVPIEGVSPVKRMRNWPEEAMPCKYKYTAFDQMEDGSYKPNRPPKVVITGPKPRPPPSPIKESLSPIIEASKHYNSPPQFNSSFNLPQPRVDLPSSIDNHAFNKKMKSLTKQKKLLKDKMFKDKSSKDKSFKEKSFKDKSLKDKSFKEMTLPEKTMKEKTLKERKLKRENLDGFPKHKSNAFKTKKPKKIPKSRSLILDDIGLDGEENDKIDVGDPFCMLVKNEIHDDAFSQDGNYDGAKQTRISSYIDTIDSVIKNGQASEVSELDYGIDIVNNEMVAKEADREDNSPSIDRFNFDCSNDLSGSKQQEKAERAARISDTINMVAESSFDPLDLNSDNVVSGHMVEEECVEEILPWSDEEPMEPFHGSPKQKSIPSASLQFSDVEDIEDKQKSQNQQITGLELILQEKLAEELSDSSEILNDTASVINPVASPIWSKVGQDASPLDIMEKMHSPSFYSLPERVEFDDMAQPPLKRIRISGIGKEELSIKEHNRGHGIIDLGERSHKKDKKDEKDKKKSKKHKDKDGDSLKEREKKKSKHKDHDSKREDREKRKHSKEEKHRRKEEKHRNKEQDAGRKLVDDEKERHRLEKERHKEEKLRKQLEEERQREFEKKKQQEAKEKLRIENELRMERVRRLEEEKERERLRLEELKRKRLEELEKERRREEAEWARREELERERANAEKEHLRGEHEEKDWQKEERERKKHKEEKAKRREEKEKMKMEKEKKKEEKERLRLENEIEKKLNDEREKLKEMKEKLKEKTGKESKKKSLEEKVEELKREKMLKSSKQDQKKHRKNEDKPSEEKSEKIPKLTLKFGGATVCGMPSTSIGTIGSSSSSNSPSLPVPAPLKIVINKTSYSNSPSSVAANPSPKHVPKTIASAKKSSDRSKFHESRSPSPSSKRKFNSSPAVSDFSSSPDRDSFSIPSIASSRSSSPKFPMVKNTPPPPSLSVHAPIPTKKPLPTSRLLLSAESPSPPLLSQTPYTNEPTLSKSKKSASAGVSKKSKRQQTSVLSTPVSIFPTTSTSGKGRGKKLPAIVTETVGKIQKDDGEIIWICPVCKLQDDGSPMIGCDTCDDWYHWPCVNIFEEPPEDLSWYCPRCSKDSSSIKGKAPAAASAKKGRGKKGKNK